MLPEKTYRALRGHMSTRPYKVTEYHTESYWTVWDHKGPYSTMQDRARPNKSRFILPITFRQ